LFGHSGSQAPQLMHSDVIIIAIGKSFLLLFLLSGKNRNKLHSIMLC
jgi:hypothetical protein